MHLRFVYVVYAQPGHVSREEDERNPRSLANIRLQVPVSANEPTTRRVRIACGTHVSVPVTDQRGRLPIFQASPSPIPSLYLADIYRVTTLFTTHAPLSTPVSQFEPDAAVCNYENRISNYGQKGLRGARVSPEKPVKELLHSRGFVINLVGTDNRVGTSNRVR